MVMNPIKTSKNHLKKTNPSYKCRIYSGLLHQSIRCSLPRCTLPAAPPFGHMILRERHYFAAVEEQGTTVSTPGLLKAPFETGKDALKSCWGILEVVRKLLEIQIFFLYLVIFFVFFLKTNSKQKGGYLMEDIAFFFLTDIAKFY